uniref:(northern house mosquito) hypothetical protein n=1 Tax=Culex pipiens TaxID=7175 RepID=A0A8D8MSV7_CULPI
MMDRESDVQTVTAQLEEVKRCALRNRDRSQKLSTKACKNIAKFTRKRGRRFAIRAAQPDHPPKYGVVRESPSRDLANFGISNGIISPPLVRCEFPLNRPPSTGPATLSSCQNYTESENKLCCACSSAIDSTTCLSDERDNTMSINELGSFANK